MIEEKNLKKGLITTKGYIVTAVGRDKILYIMDGVPEHLDIEFDEPKSVFCQKYTEQHPEEIIKGKYTENLKV